MLLASGICGDVSLELRLQPLLSDSCHRRSGRINQVSLELRLQPLLSVISDGNKNT